MNRPALQVVPESGEIPMDCPGCAQLQVQVAGLERDIRAWRSRYAALSRDAERDARDHPRWDEAGKLFDYWRTHCRHPRSEFDAGRFRQVVSFLERDGEELCRQAIDGAAFDPFTTQRKNGSVKRHDGWELIFRDRGKFEEFVNRAPRGDK